MDPHLKNPAPTYQSGASPHYDLDRFLSGQPPPGKTQFFYAQVGTDEVCHLGTESLWPILTDALRRAPARAIELGNTKFEAGLGLRWDIWAPPLYHETSEPPRDEWIARIPRDQFVADLTPWWDAGWQFRVDDVGPVHNRIVGLDGYRTFPSCYVQTHAAQDGIPPIVSIFRYVVDLRTRSCRDWIVREVKRKQRAWKPKWFCAGLKTGWHQAGSWARWGQPHAPIASGPVTPTTSYGGVLSASIYAPGEYEALTSWLIERLARDGIRLYLAERPWSWQAQQDVAAGKVGPDGYYDLGHWLTKSAKAAILGWMP